jgi:hypothetical protein
MVARVFGRRDEAESSEVFVDVAWGPVEDVTLRLIDPREVEVTVKGVKTGPIPGAEVRVTHWFARRLAEGRTDAKGVVTLTIPGHVEDAIAHATAVGYAKGRSPPFAARDSQTSILLEPAGLVRIRVQHESGQPVESGASVALYPADDGVAALPDPLPMTFRPDAEGKPVTQGYADFEDVMDGTYVAFLKQGPGIARPVRVRVPGPVATLTLSEGGTIRGTVVDPIGRGVPAATVRARIFTSWGDGRARIFSNLYAATETEEDGTFVLADLVPTAWAVTVDSTETLVAPPVVWVETGAEVEIEMGDASFIRGVVADYCPTTVAVSAMPLASEQEAWSHDDWVDTGERFELGPLPAGRYLVRGSCGRVNGPTQEVDAGTENVQVPLAIGAGIRFRVVDPDGQPIRRFSVAAVPVFGCINFEQVLSPTGTFERRAIYEPGQLQICVEAMGFESVSLRGDLVEGEVLDLGDIALEPKRDSPVVLRSRP